VKETDQEELQKCRRRSRKSRAERPSDIPNLISTSVSGSQESDLDADDDYADRSERLSYSRDDPSHSTTPSTPTADASERGSNIHGLSIRLVMK
jgi:hypothetical protein